MIITTKCRIPSFTSIGHFAPISPVEFDGNEGPPALPCCFNVPRGNPEICDLLHHVRQILEGPDFLKEVVSQLIGRIKWNCFEEMVASFRLTPRGRIKIRTGK
jgi:hypothetical protein